MQSMQKLEWNTRDIVLLVTTIFGWGGNFLAIRYAVLEIPSWTALSLRLLIVGCLLLPFLNNPLPHFKHYLKLCLLLVPGNFGMLFLASALTNNVASISLYVQLSPAFAVLFAWFFLKENPGRRRIIGLLLALLAMLILFYEPNSMGLSWAIVAAIGAAMMMGVYSVMLRTIDEGMRPIDIIGWTAIMGAPIIVSIAYIVEGFPIHLITQASYSAIGGILYTSLVASIICHGSWARLCRRHPLSQVAPYTLLVPIVAVGLSVMLLAEPLNLQMIVAAIVLSAGIYLIAKSK